MRLEKRGGEERSGRGWLMEGVSGMEVRKVLVAVG